MGVRQKGVSYKMRDQIFISYSRENKRWLGMLEMYLKPLIASHKLKVWSDAQIEPGKNWSREIDEALSSARIAVLLVSPEFLASDFISKVELPALVGAQQKGELQILWVAVSPSGYKYTPIERFQAAIDPKEPLDGLSKAERGKAFVEILDKIRDAYGSEMTQEPQATPVSRPAAAPRQSGPLVVLLYKRNAQPDERVLEFIAGGLRGHGYRVFIDKHLKPGVRWAQEIAQQVRAAYAVVPLVSPASAVSEMFAYEIETASHAAQKQDGVPLLFPVRVNFEGPLLDETLAGILNPVQYVLWRGPQDDVNVLSSLLESLREPPEPEEVAPSRPAPLKPAVGPLEPPWGPVPLKSRFYVERPTDAAFHAAIEDNVGVVLVKGARQMGKTSLLARGLQRARAAGTSVVVTDLQAFNTTRLESVDKLFLTFGRMIAQQLGLKVRLEDVWDTDDLPNFNFQNYLVEHVLPQVPRLVWALDEVDRLFTYDYQNDVFGLFRSFFNKRALNPEEGWDKLTLAIIYATEAHLFITDPNMSPFNVGTPLVMRDFNPEQVAEVNSRFDPPTPLSAGEAEDLCQLVGGHPYLMRRGLYEMKKRGIKFADFKPLASSDEGPYGDHLHRILALLARDRDLLDEVREIAAGKGSSDKDRFYRLRSAGVIAGDSLSGARMRCEVYSDYLRRHLDGGAYHGEAEP
jgi:hypothetical protein